MSIPETTQLSPEVGQDWRETDLNLVFSLLVLVRDWGWTGASGSPSHLDVPSLPVPWSSVDRRVRNRLHGAGVRGLKSEEIGVEIIRFLAMKQPLGCGLGFTQRLNVDPGLGHPWRWTSAEGPQLPPREEAGPSVVRGQLWGPLRQAPCLGRRLTVVYRDPQPAGRPVPSDS